MSCPNCGRELTPQQLDNQAIFHCDNCGATFFDENGINRVTLLSALQLAKAKKTEEISGEQKRCPKHHRSLEMITNDPAVPPGVTLLRCPMCHGIFAYADDLLAFKRAQNAKVDYYKMWQTPFSSLRNVVVLSFVVLVSAGIYFSYNAVQNNTARQLQASDLIKNVDIRSSGRFLFLTFQTNTAVRSQIVFNDRTIDRQIVRNVSDELTKTHVFSTTELNLGDEITYQILTYSKSGGVIKSSERKLTVE